MKTAEELSQMARKVCPNWQQPEGDAHYRDVLKAIADAHLAGELSGIQKGMVQAADICNTSIDDRYSTGHKHGSAICRDAILSKVTESFITTSDAKSLAAKDGK